jgi:peptidoglycan/xylan/chitin deacetylase (PgdA/CDA1 family)
MGLNTPTGEMFSRADLGVLVRDGHDLGCHTFDHCDSWETPSAQFEESMVRNQQALARELPGSALKSLSYPISYPRPKTKRLAARHYSCARGGGQTFNRGFADLNYLKAFFIEQSRDNLDAIRAAIDGNAREQGWLIFATHDVCDTPTRFGCTPRCFEEVVRYASASGAAVLPVQEACRRIRGQSPA